MQHGDVEKSASVIYRIRVALRKVWNLHVSFLRFLIKERVTVLLLLILLAVTGSAHIGAVFTSQLGPWDDCKLASVRTIFVVSTLKISNDYDCWGLRHQQTQMRYDDEIRKLRLTTQLELEKTRVDAAKSLLSIAVESGHMSEENLEGMLRFLEDQRRGKDSSK